MKQKILITRPLFPDVVDRLREYFDVTINEGPRYTSQQLHAALQEMDGAIVAGGEKIDDTVVKGLPRLKAICVSAAGYNNVDVASLTRAGIIGTNSPGPADETVADFTWGLMIATARKLVEAAHWVEQGQWKSNAGSRWFGANLCDRTLGIVGMGRIGQAIARRAIGFRMKVLYHNRRRVDPAIEAECRAEYRGKDELLREADFVVLAMPYTPENYHLIGARELQLMRGSAMLFNIARGGLIDEPALAAALQENRIAAAGLDVFEGEPAVYPGLMGLSNAVLTPHIAGGTAEAQHGLASLAADNLIAALGLGPQAGKPPSVFNPEVLRK
ncbi:D-glycerate dehydrogenase [Puia sp.]|jgi:lactate dehydrogenase-like 2-hydroxyacid dehydrogenase|uniref:2-hydroxyacid dehydrogenase n=1 Tax=Puia sp. TaxID=2045100 RepID=UPI002F414F18